MATTIKLKSTVVKDKKPLPSALVIGEVAIGANSDSPALFFKDNADNIIELTPGSGVEQGPIAPVSPDAGALWFDTVSGTLNFWDGGEWVEIGTAGDSPVISVNGEIGVVVLDAAAVGALAAGDNISELANDTGFITLAEVPAGLWETVGDAVTPLDGTKGVSAVKVTATVFDLESLPALP